MLYFANYLAEQAGASVLPYTVEIAARAAGPVPGGKQQYSAHLAAQHTSHPTLDDLLAHIADHADADLSVRTLARRVARRRRVAARR